MLQFFHITLILVHLLVVIKANDLANIPFRFSTVPLENEAEPEMEENLPNNAPLKSCGAAGGVEDGQYVDVVTQYMDPLCEEVQGYCRLKKNQNYTAILRFIPKTDIQTLTVRITAVQQFGWETLFWPEYSACNKFNITCPIEPFIKVYGYNYDHVPNEIPPSRARLRLRFLGTNSNDETKRPYLCRELFLQFY